MTDFDKLNITKCKLFADAENYFSLFDKYIDGEYKSCLIYTIGNFKMIANIMRKNSDCQYYLYDDEKIVDALKIYMSDWSNFKVKLADSRKMDHKQFWEGIKNMKFDKIIMNPPYSKNLHLKILSKAIEHLEDDGKCVSLSPVRWLQDFSALNKKHSDFNKFKTSIREHVKNIDLIDKKESQKIFDGTVMGADLGIYFVTAKKEKFDFDSLLNPIVKKIKNKKLTLPVFDTDQKDGWRVRIPIIANNGGSGNNRKDDLASFGKAIVFKDGKKDGKVWHEFYATNQYSKKYTDLIQNSIKFNSETEAENFCKTYSFKINGIMFAQYYTHITKCDVHVTPDIILWMGDQINPRTKKKGYESEWTDEDFYKFFNITDEEQKIIEKTMKKYI